MATIFATALIFLSLLSPFVFTSYGLVSAEQTQLVELRNFSSSEDTLQQQGEIHGLNFTVSQSDNHSRYATNASELATMKNYLENLSAEKMEQLIRDLNHIIHNLPIEEFEKLIQEWDRAIQDLECVWSNSNTKIHKLEAGMRRHLNNIRSGKLEISMARRRKELLASGIEREIERTVFSVDLGAREFIFLVSAIFSLAYMLGSVILTLKLVLAFAAFVFFLTLPLSIVVVYSFVLAFCTLFPLMYLMAAFYLYLGVSFPPLLYALRWMSSLLR